MNRTNHTLESIGEISDYKEAAVALETALNSLQIVGEATKLNYGHSIQEDGWRHLAYSVAFHWEGRGSDKIIILPWKTGIAVASVNPSEVLARHCSDYLNAKLKIFEEWAEYFCFDKDSRKADKIYKDCRAIGKKLKHFGLTKEEIEILAELVNML